MTTTPERAVDGRAVRAARTRELLLDATVELLREGDLVPTAQRVADRAAIAPRTVYLHFADMESLFVEVGTRELTRLIGMRDPVPPDLPLEVRINRFCASRALMLETLLPVIRAARLREHLSPAIQETWEVYVSASDAETGAVFAHELAAAPAGEREELMAALFVAAGGSAWDALRRTRGLPVEAATACMRRSVAALLAAVAAQPRSGSMRSAVIVAASMS